MKTQTVEAVVEEGGVVRLTGLPFETGRRVDVTLVEREEAKSQEEWGAFLERHYGALANTQFEAPEDCPPAEIEPLW